ncbi:MAG: DNA-3-methyladenine glycosylase family protein [Eubacteriales bacterium]|jgi:N-glycosylase/DNA lyase
MNNIEYHPKGPGNRVEYIKISRVSDFDIKKTFDCGQCFRFEPVGGTPHEVEFAGVAHGKLISLASDRDTLYIYNTNPDEFLRLWRRYLGLDKDYKAICRDILSRSDNPALARAVSAGRGIRILRQDPWETLCSFIISQNNNIARIKRIISSLSKRLGERVDCRGMEEHGGNTEQYAFPTPQAIAAAGTEVLRELKVGFRAEYLADAAARVLGGGLDFNDIESTKDTATCAARLKAVKGVGDKVAACILLFAFGRYDAFPVDVWIGRVIEKYFGGCRDACLGPYAGVAQQYLYYYERYLKGE